MTGKRLTKEARHRTLLSKIEANPLLTDEQLAKEWASAFKQSASTAWL